MRNAELLILDVETGGFSLDRNPILEIGWAFVDKDLQVLAADSVHILPPNGTILKTAEDQVVPEGTQWVIEKQAADINGYNEELWLQMNAVGYQAARDHFYQIMASYDKPVAWGHNVPTEDRWVKKHFPAFHPRVKDWQCSMKALRTYCKAKGIPIEKGTLTLQNGCKVAGYTNRGAHGALEDCLATVALMRFLRGEHSLAC